MLNGKAFQVFMNLITYRPYRRPSW